MLKELFLLRHGDALDLCQAKVSADKQRPLSENGKRRVESAALGLKILAYQPKEIWTSPYLRACQTAQIVGKVLKKEVQEKDWLSSGCSPEEVQTQLLELDTPCSLMIVGHQPDMGRMFSYFLAGSSQGGISYPKGGIARFCFSEGVISRGKLRGFFTDKILAEIAKLRSLR